MALTIGGSLASLLAVALSIVVLLHYRQSFTFDDAYMFLRYADHLRHAHAIAWNIDGVPTYGLTSLTWFAVIFLASFLPISAMGIVTLASWLTGMLAFAAMAAVITSESKTPFLRSPAFVFPIIAFLFLLNPHFDFSMVNGMETMLALLLNTLFCRQAFRFLRAPSAATGAALAILGCLATLTRPEAALCVVLIPALAWWLLLKRRHVGALGTFFAVYATSMALDLLLCRMYFHSAVPLSFYMKSRHAYLGYANFWDWPQYLLLFLEATAPAWLVILVLGRRPHLPILVTFLVPVALTFAYLATVTQIMGASARYYMPYAAFVVLPAFQLLDSYYVSRQSTREIVIPRWPLLRIAALSLLFLYAVEYPRITGFEQARLLAYPQPIFYVPARQPLPPLAGWKESIEAFTQDVVKNLPAGSTVAASEVGMIGAAAPQVNVIDLGGLNDTYIAQQGFSTRYLLGRAPDVIWMPHPDYTYLYGTLASDPALTRDYTVLAGAFNYGIAVRRSSLHYPAVMAALNRSWASLYPGTRLSDYVVDHVNWQGGPLRPAEANLPPISRALRP